VDAWIPGVESVATFLIGVLRFLAGLLKSLVLSQPPPNPTSE
jgi:hypothetical protein